MEKVISTDNCMICGVLMEEDRYELTTMLSFSQKPVYSLIEEFTETSFSDDIVRDAAICSTCITKLNDYDEFQKLSSQIQDEVANLFYSTITNQDNPAKEQEELLPKLELEEADDVFVYPALEELHSELGDDEMILAHEVADLPEVVMEYGTVDRKDLPRDIQFIQREAKQKVIKTRPIKSSTDSFTIVQLDNNIRLYQCDICNRTFKEKSKLKAHKEIHTTERKIVCPVCDKAFKTAACLRSHKRVHNPTVIECDFCGKTYTQKPELAKHINFVHFNRRDYVCEYCNAGFGCRGHLKAHYLTHQQFKGVTCKICNYSFHTKAKLDRHMRSHTGQRDYECGICGKRFLYSYNVSAHIRHVHWKEKRKTEERSKTCKICDTRFNSRDKLRDHLQVVHQFVEIDESFLVEEEEDDSNLVEYEEDYLSAN